ncbi:MAG: DNA helicase UvrD [Pseudomonadota bacterium]
MDKQLVCAVAGSGKTTLLVSQIESAGRCLVISYTRENVRSIEASLLKKYGRIPKNVYLTTYFSFLYRFCYRPFFHYTMRDKSFTWKLPPFERGGPKKSCSRHYLTSNRYLYANRVAKLIIENEMLPKLTARLEKYFDDFFIDEIQDFAARDFDLVLGLSEAAVNTTFVGDYYQHTFDTSRDGPIRKNLHKKGLESYLHEFRNTDLAVDTSSLSKSYRCGPAICSFISKQLDIQIESHRDDESKVEVISCSEKAAALFDDDTKVKLFYDEHYKYQCFSNNWGKCKGLNNYVDVCVVLNKKCSKLFADGKLAELPDSTKNKLYVACSRAKGDLYILNSDAATARIDALAT